jgi:hypothetical protein
MDITFAYSAMVKLALEKRGLWYEHKMENEGKSKGERGIE